MITQRYPGKFLVIEGLDGSGKTSQVQQLVLFLQQQGKQVVLTKEPTEISEAGKKARKVLRGELSVSPLELQKLFVADRENHLKALIIPALEEGAMVVSSRYAFSTFAYGGSEGLNLDELMAMNSTFLLPDATIIIDVPAEDCIKRIETRGEQKEYFEQLAKLKTVANFYRQFPSLFKRVHLVDGTRSVEQVFEQVKDLVQKVT